MGGLYVGADATADLKPVRLRHNKVGYDYLRHYLFHLRQTIKAVDRRIDIIIRGQPLFQIIPQLRVILYHKYVIRFSSFSLR